MLLILLPGVTTAEDTSVFDRITGFFSDRFNSSESEVPKARSLEACTALSEDAHELMIQRQEGRTVGCDKSALEMADKAAWPSNTETDAESAYMQLTVRPTPRSQLVFLPARPYR